MDPGGRGRATSARCSTLIVLASSRRRGAELEGLGLGSELRRAGHRVEVVALVEAGDGGRLPVEALGGSPYSASTLARLRRRARTADVVVAFGSSTLPACAVATLGTGTPFVYRSIGDPRAWVRGPLHRWRTGLLFRRAAHVVALWGEVADGLGDLYRVPPDRTSVIPNARAPWPVAVEDHDVGAARTRLGVPGDGPVVAVVGALSDEKRVELAIEVSAALPEVHLLVVGDGPRRSELERLAGSLNPSGVTFTGAVEDVGAVLRLSDVLLVTSRTEGMPGVVIEAGLAGRPTVSTAVGAVPEMVMSGTSGYVASSDAVEDLAAGVRSALANRDEWGEAARRRMERCCSWEVVAPMWSTLLTSIAARRGDPAPA